MDGVLACPADDCGRLNVEEADECCYCGHSLHVFSYYCDDCGRRHYYHPHDGSSCPLERGYEEAR